MVLTQSSVIVVSCCDPVMGAHVTSAQSGPRPEAFHLRHVIHATAIQNCSAHCNLKFRSGTVIPIAHCNLKSQGARHELPTKTVPRAVRKPFGVVRDSYVLSFGFGGFLKPYAASFASRTPNRTPSRSAKRAVPPTVPRAVPRLVSCPLENRSSLVRQHIRF